jgi:pimeloyl-ACP methyl ester carboxylesterase
MAQVWYPAKITSRDVPAAWMPHAKIFTRAIARYINFPSFFLDHLALIKMPSYQDAAISDQDDNFPVIIFSHGWSGFNTQNTSQAIELASHGYVVISIQHTYGAVMTVFSDGTIAPGNPKTLPEDENDADYELVARKLVDQWVGDMGFVLDEFDSLNKTAGNRFFEKLDLQRVGVYGHSTGSGAAIQFCARDSRGKAVLGMDPFMRPVAADVIAGGISQPSFFMFSQLWADVLESRNNILFRKLRANLQGNKGVIRIAGTRHYDFSDVPLLSPIGAQLGLRGALNGGRVTEIVTAYLLDFFESTLRDRPSNLLQSPPFPEVKELI